MLLVLNELLNVLRDTFIDVIFAFAFSSAFALEIALITRCIDLILAVLVLLSGLASISFDIDSREISALVCSGDWLHF